MAITIHQQLDEITPAYNEMIYVVSSTNVAESNFKYIADVYIDGTYTKRLTLPANPTYNNCVVDVHRIVETALTYDISISETSGVTQCLNSWCEVVVKFGEEYGLSSSGVTVYPDLTNSSGCFAFAGSLPEFDFIDYVDNDYILDSSGSLFMTNIPRTNTNITRNQSLFLAGYQNTDNDIDRFVILTYDSSGTFVDEYQITNQYDTPASDDNDRFLKFIAGFNANDIPQAQLVTGTQPIFTDSIYSYAVYTVDGSGNKTSETITFNIQEECTPYENFELHFQNVFGFFDSFIFSSKSNTNVSIDRKEYKKQTGTTSSTAFTTTKADRGYENYFTSSNKKITLRSRWMTETEYEWLTELIESPQVFWNYNSELIAINIVSNEYELKKVANDNLIQIEIQIKLSTNNYRQRY